MPRRRRSSPRRARRSTSRRSSTRRARRGSYRASAEEIHKGIVRQLEILINTPPLQDENLKQRYKDLKQEVLMLSRFSEEKSTKLSSERAALAKAASTIESIQRDVDARAAAVLQQMKTGVHETRTSDALS